MVVQNRILAFRFELGRRRRPGSIYAPEDVARGAKVTQVWVGPAKGGVETRPRDRASYPSAEPCGASVRRITLRGMKVLVSILAALALVLLTGLGSAHAGPMPATAPHHDSGDQAECCDLAGGRIAAACAIDLLPMPEGLSHPASMLIDTVQRPAETAAKSDHLAPPLTGPPRL